MLLTNEFVKQYNDFEIYIIELIIRNREFICEAAGYYANHVYVEFSQFAVIDDIIYIEFGLEYSDGEPLGFIKIPYSLLEPQLNDNLKATQTDYIDKMNQQRIEKRKLMEQEKEREAYEIRKAQYLRLREEFKNEFE